MNADLESKNYYEDKTIFMDEMTRLYLESKKNRRKRKRFVFLLARKEG